MFEIVGRDLGQNVVLENRPGARGTQAAIFLKQQAKPDGYTLAHHHLSILRHPFLTKQPTWDPVEDFTYVMQVSGFTFGTAVRSDSPWKTFRELMDAAKRRPGLAYSVSPFRGRAISRVTTASTRPVPATMSATASAIGISSPRARASATRSARPAIRIEFT